MKDFCLVQGDCMTEIPQIEGPVDMIFADPPYFLSTGNGTVKIGIIASIKEIGIECGQKKKSINLIISGFLFVGKN